MKLGDAIWEGLEIILLVSLSLKAFIINKKNGGGGYGAWKLK